MNINELFPRQPKLYSCSAIAGLIEKYLEKGGEVHEIEPGCLGYGFMILEAPGCKTAIVKEVYINSQSSAHTVRFYNVIPKKYAAMI